MPVDRRRRRHGRALRLLQPRATRLAAPPTETRLKRPGPAAVARTARRCASTARRSLSVLEPRLRHGDDLCCPSSCAARLPVRRQAPDLPPHGDGDVPFTVSGSASTTTPCTTIHCAGVAAAQASAACTDPCAVRILACMNASSASTEATPAAVAAELLDLWREILSGSTRSLYALLAELDLSMTQLKMLHVLVECEAEVSVKELAEELNMSLPNASRTIDGLLQRGLLERREDEHDRRIKRVGADRRPRAS